MEINSNNLKIAVVHDHLGWSGGGERTALIIALETGADFLTVYREQSTFADYQARLSSRLVTFTDKIINKEVIRFFWLRYIFWENRKKFADYDILIASGQAALESVSRLAKPGTIKILYEHTPPRRVFDLFHESRSNYKWFLRPLYSIFARYWKHVYLKAADKMDYRIANSENIKNRIKKFTGRVVDEVIWPPILTHKFKWISQGDYYLSFARLDEQKRVEDVLKAFTRMPDKKLIIASGGPRLEKIKALTKGYANIQVLGWVSDTKLFDLVGSCIATIYIPHDEDAGMTHLEANAAGKPVLGVDEGGLSESIISNETGLKMKPNPSTEDIIKQISLMTPEWCLSRQKTCEAYARNFSQEIFSNKIKDVIARLVNKK